jgi:hypothetical protein
MVYAFASETLFDYLARDRARPAAREAVLIDNEGQVHSSSAGRKKEF